MSNLASELFKVEVSKPEVNKIDYYQDGGGWWAFLTETPTTKAFGKEKQDSFRNLIVELSRCRE